MRGKPLVSDTCYTSVVVRAITFGIGLKTVNIEKCSVIIFFIFLGQVLPSSFLAAYQTAHHCQHHCCLIGWMAKTCCPLTWTNYRKSLSLTLCWNSFKGWMIHNIICTKIRLCLKQIIFCFQYQCSY